MKMRFYGHLLIFYVFALLLAAAPAFAIAPLCQSVHSNQTQDSTANFLKVLKQLEKGKGTLKPLSEKEKQEIQKTMNDFEYHTRIDPKIKKLVEDQLIQIIFRSKNLEKTYSLIYELGLDRKFYNSEQMGENGPKINSLLWWLKKKPLPTRPLGELGKTAQELGLSQVAHNTHSESVLKSMASAVDGKPNVFISRFSYPGETAMHGDGFYTRIGKKGVGGSYTLLLGVHPQAREGRDFKIIGGEYVVFFNRSALQVIPL